MLRTYERPRFSTQQQLSMQRRSLSVSAAFLKLFSAAAWAKIISANFPPALQERRVKQWAAPYIESQL
jgi:hypothetical protein